MRIIAYSPEAWKYLNGIFCIYKPSGIIPQKIKCMIAINLVRDLNQLEVRPPRNYIQTEFGKSLSVATKSNFADHSLVIGPRYQIQDIELDYVTCLGRNGSGVMVMAVNNGIETLRKFRKGNHLRTYYIKGQFGYATDTFLNDGKILERATFGHISHYDVDRAISSIQCTHQVYAYKYAGVPIESQAAYELASSGIIRPNKKSPPLIYGIKCIHFNLPNFTIEIHCINETETYLCEIVHDLGLYLKSCAVCIQLQQIRFGCFSLNHALLRKHWTIAYILNNIQFCKEMIEKNKAVPSTATFEKITNVSNKTLLEKN